MKLHRATLVAGFLAQLITASFAQAADTSIPAQSVTQIVTIQPIDVCDAGGGNCASLASLPDYQQAANAVWNQAGLGFVFLPAAQFNDPSPGQNFLNPTITIAPGFPTGTPTDLAHQLMYGPGHGQSSNPTTLNVWFVDTLSRTDGIGVYGSGFIGGNGIVIPTLPNPNTGGLPVLDTVAHELGHNLGLAHVDSTSASSPFNLMQSVGRTFPTDPCQINANNCSPIGPATDNLLATQAATARNPLFTVDLAHVTATVDHSPGFCAPGSPSCDIHFSFDASTTTQSLLAFKVRFLDPNAIFNGTLLSSSSPQGITGTGPITGLLSPTGGFVEYDFAPGVFGPGNSFDLQFSYSKCQAEDFDSVCAFSQPFSVEFDFSSGITSGALFDASGFADSQHPGSDLQRPFAQGLGFIGTPTYGLGKTVPVVACADVEGNQNTADESPCGFSDIPEPPAIRLFAAALVLLCVGRRGRPPWGHVSIRVQ